MGALETPCHTYMTTASATASDVSHFSAEIRAATRKKTNGDKEFLQKHAGAPGRETTSVTCMGARKKKEDLVFIRVKNNTDE